VFPVRYELGFCIPEDGVLHSHCRENVKSYNVLFLSGNVQNLLHVLFRAFSSVLLMSPLVTILQFPHRNITVNLSVYNQLSGTS
jgi:hypothetical protein